ncbi:double-strand break repair helicase AddA [Segnochrobactraceae bacterium EtOH-i3]
MSLAIPPETVAAQSNATDPEASAWVSANAGSGKTFVLVRRVLRLLLAGANPGAILCLTFTRSAAANMAERVFSELARFATASEAELPALVTEIEGTPPTPQKLETARRLFARALETPGGLKIQTIHAFCEALLQRFPLEANVAGRFEILDDTVSAELTDAAFADTFLDAVRDPDGPVAGAIATLMPRLRDQSLKDAISALVGRRRLLLDWIAAGETLTGALDLLAEAIGIAPGTATAHVHGAIVDGSAFSDGDLNALDAALSKSSGANDAKALVRLQAAIAARGTVLTDGNRVRAEASAAEDWAGFFLTGKGEARKWSALVSKKVKEALPGDFEDMVAAEQERLTELNDQLSGVRALEGTAALLTLANAVLTRVETEKGRRGLVDFDDLVARAADLLSRADAAAWVRYKLDTAIDHVLVDEAQDTSPDQWAVIEGVIGDFFAGEGARPAIRTVFAVGDEKQSIYGFQGAAPEIFARKAAEIARLARESGARFHPVTLSLSFRSTPDVVKAVDAVFALPEAYAGLTTPPAPTVHAAVRAQAIGRVEIWPPVAGADSELSEDWTQPIDHVGRDAPEVELARRIADRVERMVRTPERLPDGRPVTEGDVLILVRKRGPFVEAMNRELKSRALVVAGADRLVVTDHIAVKDLVALAAALLLPADDLSLAASLRSPLFEVGEEDLFRFANGRKGTLRRAIELQARDGDALAAVTHDRLDGLAAIARRSRPFEFFAEVLGPRGGRRRFRTRLGDEVEDVLDAFLDLTLAYERTDTPTLQGFLAFVDSSATEIKRDAEAVGRSVRVMTVHGAKGLEAPVVFVVDPGGAPVHAAHLPKVVALRSDDPRDPVPLVWSPGKDSRPAAVEAALASEKERAEAEYRRLLYVALTRARDWLIVCGLEPKRGLAAGCWQELVAAGLEADARSETEPDGTEIQVWELPRDGRVVPPPRPDTPPPADDDGAEPEMPDLASALTVAEREIVPSEALPHGREGERRLPALLRGSPETGEAALRRGRLIHRLLEMLPELPAGERAEAARRVLAAERPRVSAEDVDAFVDEALAVLDTPALAPLFTASARAEVDVIGRLPDADGAEVRLSGRIDRLVDAGDHLLIVDLKTDRPAPDDAAGVPDSYAAQLALYRRLLLEATGHARPVRAAILWTAARRLDPVPPARLDALLNRVLARR